LGIPKLSELIYCSFDVSSNAFFMRIAINGIIMIVSVIDALRRLLFIPSPTIKKVYPNSPITTDGIPAKH
jgi:hypothetical protein